MGSGYHVLQNLQIFLRFKTFLQMLQKRLCKTKKHKASLFAEYSTDFYDSLLIEYFEHNFYIG